MFACHLDDRVVLVSTNQLGKLISELTSDAPDLDLFSFKVALDQNVAVGNAKARFRKWESLFCTRLEKAISSGDVSVSHDFVGDLARTHVEDFLELYRVMYR